MPLFRKKPVVIQATQWFKNGDHPQDDCETIIATGQLDLPAGTPFQGEGKIVRYFRHPDVDSDAACKHCGLTMHVHGWIDTLEGGHIVCPGDFIITGVNGENYPCKPDIFEKTYDAAGSAIAFKAPNQYLAEAKLQHKPEDANCECTTVPECVANAALVSMFEDYRKSRGPLMPAPEFYPIDWDKYDAAHGK